MEFQEVFNVLQQFKQQYFVPPYKEDFTGVSIVPCSYLEACYGIQPTQPLDDLCFLVYLKKKPGQALPAAYNGISIFYSIPSYVA